MTIVLVSRDYEPPQFPERVRFNWGFHDGQDDVQKGRPVRPTLDRADPAFIAGYTRGRALAERGIYSETSEPTWQAFIAETTADLARHGMEA